MNSNTPSQGFRWGFRTGFRGYITSTPKSDKKPKKHEKRPKNERASCIPRRFFGERPYLASFFREFSGPFLPPFCPFYPPSVAHPNPKYCSSRLTVSYRNLSKLL